MHDEAAEWVANMRTYCVGRRVLELGSRDVNGSARPQFATADRYVGVDLVDGPGVDIVADACHFRTVDRFDVVVCTEVLEHVRPWPMIVVTAAEHLESGGHLILTAAAEGREPHSAAVGDSDVVVPPADGEYYDNIDVGHLLGVLRANELEVIVLEYLRYPGDVHVLARKR